jgi:hypothetical protein
MFSIERPRSTTNQRELGMVGDAVDWTGCFAFGFHAKPNPNARSTTARSVSQLSTEILIAGSGRCLCSPLVFLDYNQTHEI